MRKGKVNKILLVLVGLALSALFIACGGDKTGNTADRGQGLVSDGGFGSKISIDLESGGSEIATADQVKFKVTATDPQGAPLSNIRIFCESEHGIAIIEPSKGGVAFEHTSTSGIMSGVLGGLSPGSFLIECRGPQGFNLIARKTFKVVGDVPTDFAGWPGAAGGNLGGGVILDPTNQDVAITQVTISGSGEGTRTGDVDIVQQGDCDGDATTFDPEPFFADNFNAEFVNGLNERIFVNAAEIDLYSGSTLVDSSVRALGGLVIAAQSSTTLTGAFTEVISAKTLAGSPNALGAGTYNVVFSFSFTTASGQSGVVEQTAAIRVGNFNNCSSS